MKFKEIETKYNAEDMPYSVFEEFCQSRNPDHFILASGYDHFYDKKGDSTSFFRHRMGSDMNQLTFKKKTEAKNNFVRDEFNCDVSMTRDEVKAFVGALGYEYNTSIFKTCFVFSYDFYVLSYYICYSLDMKEMDRFVEIEMREDKDFGSDEDAWTHLLVLEKLGKEIGLNPKGRIKRSLFEIYREER